jgi:homopolymeric O-antigen transport system ATP-binding protein
MSDSVITVQSLSKSYLLGHRSADGKRYTALRDVIAVEARNFARKAADLVLGRAIVEGDEVEEFWALSNVSFEVKRGEVLGIIGRNGAGKSTLLKILSRVTEPTQGRVVLRGRVASLLEVGTGFHPELTGRENIFLNGAILGMTRREIREKFDQIVAFAEIERFVDTPVKRYSSGMYVRLAFAIAAHLEPEILIIDEVLAVGDAEFQRKCLGKMSEVARESRTVIFVSHNLGAVKALTQRSILLDQGRIVTSGNTEDVIKAYLIKALEDKATALQSNDLGLYRSRQTRDAQAKIVRIGVNGSWGDPEVLPRISMGAKFTIEVELAVYMALRGADIVLWLKTSGGENLTIVYSADHRFNLSLRPGHYRVRITIGDLPLVPGRYFLDAAIDTTLGGYTCDVIRDYPLLTVVNEGQVTNWLHRSWGVVHCQAVEFAVSSVEADAHGESVDGRL